MPDVPLDDVVVGGAAHQTVTHRISRFARCLLTANIVLTVIEVLALIIVTLILVCFDWKETLGINHIDGRLNDVQSDLDGKMEKLMNLSAQYGLGL
jgi:hypothetical protein